MSPWKVLDSETVAKTPRFDLIKEHVSLPNGATKDVYLTKHSDAAVILPVTPDGHIVMLKEYRHPCREKLLGLAGGHLEDDDTPEGAARRELLEETGYTADRFELVQSVYPDPSRTGRRWHFFIAHGAIKTGSQCLTEFEDVDVILMPANELLSHLSSGSISNLPDMGLIYLGLHKLGLAR